MDADDSSTQVTLMDTVERVPQLLQCVAQNLGVKYLRLICKPASLVAFQVIESYSLVLFHEFSAHLSQEQATFLKHTRLRHLRIYMVFPSGVFWCLSLSLGHA